MDRHLWGEAIDLIDEASQVHVEREAHLGLGRPEEVVVMVGHDHAGVERPEKARNEARGEPTAGDAGEENVHPTGRDRIVDEIR